MTIKKTIPPQVVLTGFADECSNSKTMVEQFATFAALGLQYYSVRFVNLGDGVKNVMKLTTEEIRSVLEIQNDYGLNVSSIGSPIGKIKLLDVDDGSKDAYIPFEDYLNNDVKRVCDVAHMFETKLIRGFSFYQPKGDDPQKYISQAVDRLGKIAETCHRSDLTFGLEVEANLIGCNGWILADIYRQVNHPAMKLIFDAANLVVQGYTTAEIFEQYEAMKPGIGWMHIKDYSKTVVENKGGRQDEDKMKGFVPCDQGYSGHEAILRDFAKILPSLTEYSQNRGIPGVFLDLEPHVKGGGQFGGYSGCDGLGVALRALCKTLDYVGIDYHLRDFDDIRAARGF
ncbi:MAG: sugar phosphate isomerase/epimerase [Thermoguttaceae bacterium]|nr:sugar phosphate isomerase/epimerase [Thermoguttaceae bacterium]MBR5758688.1 sugar phosphate isomerase/epimerase [Thermoguttaceae bacterium]